MPPREWPKDGKPASFEDLTLPIRKAIRFAYKLERRNVEKDIPWRGLPKGRHELVCTLPIEKALSSANLRYSLDDQGRDALQEILAVQCQLAFEQGRRIALQDIETWLMLIEVTSGSDQYTRKIREYFYNSN